MGKKANTFWFMLAATAVNVLLMLFFFTIGFILISLLYTKWPALAENSAISLVSVLVLFVGSTALTLFVYNRILTFVQKKFKLEDHLYPFLAPKGKRQSRGDY